MGIEYLFSFFFFFVEILAFVRKGIPSIHSRFYLSFRIRNNISCKINLS